MGTTFNKKTGHTNLPKKLGEPTGMVDRPMAVAARYHLNMRYADHRPECRYWWSLVEPEGEGLFRECVACQGEFAPGACSVHLSKYNFEKRRQDLVPNPCWHVACVTPREWHNILGHPQGIPHKRDRGIAPISRTWRNLKHAIDSPRLNFEPRGELIGRLADQEGDDHYKELKTALAEAGAWSGQPATFLVAELERLFRPSDAPS